MSIRAGAYGILLDKGRVLMCHTHTATRIIMNFPGGALEQGEEPEEGCLREFQEEVGVQAQIVKHLHATEDGRHFSPDYPDLELAYSYFLVRADVSEITLDGNGDDVEKLEWVPVNGLPVEQMLAVDIHSWKHICAAGALGI